LLWENRKKVKVLANLFKVVVAPKQENRIHALLQQFLEEVRQQVELLEDTHQIN
jgi:hypothetical protein